MSYNSKHTGAEIEALLDKAGSAGMNYVELSEPTVPLAAVNTCYYMNAYTESTFTIQAFETPTTPEAHYLFRFYGTALSLTMPDVNWQNGEVPEMDDSYCGYELDVVATHIAPGMYIYKAILAKFPISVIS